MAAKLSVLYSLSVVKAVDVLVTIGLTRTFKAALNEAIRAANRRPGGSPEFRTRTFDLGLPRLPIDKALRLAADLEEELLRKLAERK